MNNAMLQQAGNLEKAHNEMMLDRDSLARENDRLREQVKALQSELREARASIARKNKFSG